MVPMSVDSSSGSPIFMAFTFSFSLSTKASWMLSWTKMRDDAVQLWPWRVKRMPAMAPAMA